MDGYLELHAARSILLHIIARSRLTEEISPTRSELMRLLYQKVREIEVEIHATKPDNCQRCHGARGGVLGNENILNVGSMRMILCDYCHADDMGKS